MPRSTERRKPAGSELNLPWWLITGWIAGVTASVFLVMKPLNDVVGRQPSTILWLCGVAIATFFLREWLSDGRLERIDAGRIGAPGRLWGRFHDRFEHVFLAITGLHMLAVLVAVLVGIAQTGPIAMAIIVGFAVLLVPFLIWATIAARRDLKARARRLAERELKYARRANVRSADDFAG